MDFTNPNYLPRIKVVYRPDMSVQFIVSFDFNNLSEDTRRSLELAHPAFDEPYLDLRQRFDDHKVEIAGEWMKPSPAFEFKIGGFTQYNNEVEGQIKAYCAKHKVIWCERFDERHLDALNQMADWLDDLWESLHFKNKHWYGDEDYTEEQQLNELRQSVRYWFKHIVCKLSQHRRNLHSVCMGWFDEIVDGWFCDEFNALCEWLEKECESFVAAELVVLDFRCTIKELLNTFDMYIKQIEDSFSPVVNHEQKKIQIPKTLGDLIELAVELNWDMDHAFDHFFTEEFEKELASFIESKGYSVGLWGGE